MFSGFAESGSPCDCAHCSCASAAKVQVTLARRVFLFFSLLAPDFAAACQQDRGRWERMEDALKSPGADGKRPRRRSCSSEGGKKRVVARPAGEDVEAFMSQLLEVDSDAAESCLGMAIDVDELLARRLQDEEEALLLQRQEEEERDFELAKQLSREVSDGSSGASFRLALELQATEDEMALGNRGKSRVMVDLVDDYYPVVATGKDEDEDLKLARLLQVQFEMEQRRDERQRELQDFALAQQIAAAEKESAQLLKKQRAALLPAPSPSAPPITPDPPHDADGESVIEQHMEFLAGSDLAPLRTFLSLRKGSVRIRPILRPDLEAKFRAKAQAFSEARGLQYAAPALAFHGTRADVVDSISEKGLVAPGSGGVVIRNGNRFGNGVYTSPCPDYADAYSREGKLIVCAVLLGRACVIDSVESYNGGNGPAPGFDSHFALKKEYVSFDPSCVLPLFLLDYPKAAFGAGNAQFAAAMAGFNRPRRAWTQRPYRRR